MNNIISNENITNLINEGYTNQQIIKRINQSINETLTGGKYHTIPYESMTLKLFLYSNSINENMKDDTDYQYILHLIDMDNKLDENKEDYSFIMEDMEKKNMYGMDEGYDYINEKKKNTLQDLQTRISSLMVKSKGNPTKYSFYTGLSVLLLAGMVTSDTKKQKKLVTIVKSLISRMK